MIDESRLEHLLTSLGMEILSARGGSPEGQFPILDLLGNLRDETTKMPNRAEMALCCQKGWDRMVGIVESGQCFSPEDIQWLKELLARLQSLAKPDGPGQTEFIFPNPRGKKQQLEAIEAMLVLNPSTDADLLREFVSESREHLDNIEQGILVLEKKPTDGETLNTIFRAFHTFKGSAGFLNLTPVHQLAHVLESLLDLARQNKLTIDATVIDLILNGKDLLKRFLDEIDGQISGAKAVQPVEISTAQLRRQIQSLIDKLSSGQPVLPSALPHQTPRLHSGDTALLDSLLKGHAPTTMAPPEVAAETAAPPVVHPEQNAIVKVETGKLDSMLDLIGEMVIAQSLVASDLSSLTESNPHLARNTAHLSRITKELQRVSVSMRMVPIRGAFQKMARVVRDIANWQNKKAQLLTHGEDTELDRNVVEQLNDPLLHMIRNSMDHGIEPPDVRAAKGKSPMGTIRLRAYHKGGSIVIEITDDGSGLDRDRILAKAVERGMVAEGAELTDEQVFAFIFAPGFSTAEKLTEISGRGVGLDVVKRNIEQLRGTVDISSVRGKGAQFKVTLPLTLAIIEGLVVKVGSEQYIIPTLSVQESFRFDRAAITSVHGRGEVVNVRGRLIPLLRLSEKLNGIRSRDNSNEGIGIVVHSGNDTRCLLVDSLLAKQEVVIKNLNELMVHKNRFFAGAAILGDGRVGLILDANALVHPEPESYSRAA